MPLSQSNALWWMNEMKNACNRLLISFLPLQVPTMDFMAMKRSQLYGMANNPYSTPQQPGGGPYPPSQPYTSPPPHRYPMSMQGRSQMGMGGIQYPQQQVCQQPKRLQLWTCESVSVCVVNQPRTPSPEPFPITLLILKGMKQWHIRFTLWTFFSFFSPEGLACSIWDAA